MHWNIPRSHRHSCRLFQADRLAISTVLRGGPACFHACSCIRERGLEVSWGRSNQVPYGRIQELTRFATEQTRGILGLSSQIWSTVCGRRVRFVLRGHRWQDQRGWTREDEKERGLGTTGSRSWEPTGLPDNGGMPLSQGHHRDGDAVAADGHLITSL